VKIVLINIFDLFCPIFKVFESHGSPDAVPALFVVGRPYCETQNKLLVLTLPAKSQLLVSADYQLRLFCTSSGFHNPASARLLSYRISSHIRISSHMRSESQWSGAVGKPQRFEEEAWHHTASRSWSGCSEDEHGAKQSGGDIC
jgi:hypothetical protein